MLSGLYSAASGIRVAQINQEVTAQNLSHVDTPGYRRVVTSIFSLPVAQPPAADPLDVSNADIDVETTTRDFRTGPMVYTGRPLDVALNGEGFFAIEGPDGPLYTRNGVFQFTPDGLLVTSGGYPVAGVTGPIQIPPETSTDAVLIQRDGTVLAGNETVGQIQVVNFDNPRRLVPVSDTLFAQGEAGTQPSLATVAQGYREHSNVSATEELVRMIIGMRMHEASHRALRSISDAVRQHVNVEGR